MQHYSPYSLPNSQKNPTHCRFRYVPVIFEKSRRIVRGFNVQFVPIPAPYFTNLSNNNKILHWGMGVLKFMKYLLFWKTMQESFALE